MRKNDRIGAQTGEDPDWNSALEIVSRLAASREAAMQQPTAAQPGAIAQTSQPQSTTGAALAAPPTAIEPDHLARAVAEIEQASAVLRRTEPTLEVWRAEDAAPGEARQRLSVWVVIGGIWLAASVILASATGAILFLLG